MRQPHITEESIVPLLVQDQLTVASQTRVNFAVTVEVWGVVPGSVVVVQIQHRAFADVDEQADVLAASIPRDC